MALSSGENQHDVIEETDIDVTQLDKYSGKVSNEQTNIIEEYLLNENVIHNIEERTEGSEEIAFEHTSRYCELESNASDNTQVVVDGITFDKCAFDMFQSLVPEETLVGVQTDHDYASNVQLTTKNVVVDQPTVNTNLPRVYQYENSALTVVKNIVVDQPKVNVDLPITQTTVHTNLPRVHQYGNSALTVVENIVVDQPKVNVDLPITQTTVNTNLPRVHQYGNSALTVVENIVVDQPKVNVDLPITQTTVNTNLP